MDLNFKKLNKNIKISKFNQYPSTYRDTRNFNISLRILDTSNLRLTLDQITAKYIF